MTPRSIPRLLLALALILTLCAQAQAAGIVSIQFDDGYVSVYQKALPILKKYNLPASAAIITALIGAGSSYMTSAQIKALHDSGWEIASHSVNHLDPTDLAFSFNDEIIKTWTKTSGYANIYQAKNPFQDVSEMLQDGRIMERGWDMGDVTSLEGSFYLNNSNTFYIHPFGNVNPNNVEMRTSSQERELSQSKSDLEAMGFTVTSYVTPLGVWSDTYAAQAAKYYEIVIDGLYTSNNPATMNRYWLARYDAASSSLSALKTYIQAEMAKGSWVVLYFHGIDDNEWNPYSSANLDALCAWLKSSNITVMTPHAAFNTLVPPAVPLADTLTAPTTTEVKQGGTLGPFTAKIANLTGQTQSYSYTETYETGGSTVLTSSSGPRVLSANASTTLTRNQTVPFSWATGTYTYTIRLLDGTGTQVDEDSFTFSVTAGIPLSNSLTPPTTTSIKQGTNLGPFASRITNSTGSAISCSYEQWYKDAAGTMTQIGSATPLSVPANQTVTQNLTFPVPFTMAPGSYTYYVRLKDGSGTQVDEDSFAFTVTFSPMLADTLTPPATTTVKQGGTLGPFTATVINNTSGALAYFLAEVYKPTGGSEVAITTTGPLPIDAGKSVPTTRSYAIPADMPVGNYTYYMRLLDESGKQVDEDSFTFSVIYIPPLSNALTPPATTSVKQGSNLGPFTSTFTNSTDSAINCSYEQWYKDAAGTMTQVGSATPLSVPANQTVTQNLTFPVPFTMAPGSYTYYVRLKDGSGTQVDEDSFAFTVTYVAPLSNVLTPPTTTSLKPGATLGPFTSKVTNATASSQSYYYVEYYKNAAGTLTTIATSATKTAAAGQTVTETRNWVVPATLAPGSYTYVMRLFDTSARQLDEDSFAFTVTASQALYGTVTPPATLTVKRGSSLGPYSVLITNTTSSSASYSFEEWYETPSGGWTHVNTDKSGTVAAKTTVTTQRSIAVPSGAAAGTYTYHLLVYNGPGTQVSHVTFKFTVTQ